MKPTEWKRDKEIHFFKQTLKSRLSNLEEYFTSREEIEQNDPSMVNKMLSNIIDNLQVYLLLNSIKI